jgi:hypothetical protein
MRPVYLVVPLVLGTGIGAACGGFFGDCGWHHDTLDLGVEDDLHAVTYVQTQFESGFVAVGADGVIVESLGGSPEVHRPVAVDLHGVAIVDDEVMAVGDHGTLVRRPLDGSTDWEVVGLGVTGDLRAIFVDLDGTVFVVGDNVLLFREQETDLWTAPPAPKGGWGELRAGSFASAYPVDIVYAVGRHGVAWSTRTRFWMAEDLGTDVDLLAAAGNHIVGANGFSRLFDELSPWSVPGGGVDLIAVAGHDEAIVLTADGRVLVEMPEFEEAAALGDGVTALAGGGYSEEPLIFIVGKAGKAVKVTYTDCSFG